MAEEGELIGYGGVDGWKRKRKLRVALSQACPLQASHPPKNGGGEARDVTRTFNKITKRNPYRKTLGGNAACGGGGACQSAPLRSVRRKTKFKAQNEPLNKAHPGAGTPCRAFRSAAPARSSWSRV
jgi:hypothetical protein